MEAGRDGLEALAVGSQVARLEQRVALLSQQLAAQRCVASFLGVHEAPLREEIVALRQVGIVGVSRVFQAPLTDRQLQRCVVLPGSAPGRRCARRSPRCARWHF